MGASAGGGTSDRRMPAAIYAHAPQGASRWGKSGAAAQPPSGHLACQRKLLLLASSPPVPPCDLWKGLHLPSPLLHH